MLGKYAEAVTDYTSAIDNLIGRDSSDADLFFRRGKALTSLKKYNEAIADFSEAIKLNPKHDYANLARGLLYFQQNQYREAKADLEKAATLDPENKLAKEYLAKIAALPK
jgi:tetratricopeptide (TPR) repeat protein